METLVGFFGFLTTLVDKVPSSFWGVIIGAITALGGVVLTNRAHDRRLEKQLTSDRELKNREREMSLRKEVYLDAAEAVSAGLIAVGQFSNLEVKHEKLTEEYLAKVPLVSKISIIAKETTVKAVSNYSGELVATFMRLTAKRAPLLRQSQEIATLRTMVDSFLKEQSRIVELMNQYNLEGSADQRRWDFIQKRFDFETRRINDTSKKVEELVAKLTLKQLKFMEECVEESIRLSHLLVPAIVSVRNELELPIDESEYRKVVERSVARQTETINEFREQFKSLLPPEGLPPEADS
jgi:hypothetical protein